MPGSKAPKMTASARDDALALAIASGQNQATAARAVGLDSRTVRRRLQNPEFCKLVAEHRKRFVVAAVGQLAACGGDAVKELKALLKSDSDAVRLGAARSIIESIVRLGSYADVVDRLAAIEARLESIPEIQRPDHWRN